MVIYSDKTVGFILDYLEYHMIGQTLTEDPVLMDYAKYIHERVYKLYKEYGADYTSPEDIVIMSTLLFNVVIHTEK